MDNGSPVGDAGFHIQNLNSTVGATSDLVGIFLIQIIMTRVIDELVKAGFNPPIFKSSNIDGADEYNNLLFEKFYGFWK